MGGDGTATAADKSAFWAEAKKQNPSAFMAEGGDVTLQSDLGPMQVAGGGIAQLPTTFTPPSDGPAQPAPEEVKMVAMAVLGRIDNAGQVIEAFVQRYGAEQFRALRQMVLQSVTPNAQTEGMIQGQGGGMDDLVPGMMGDQQPMATSPGEYIVPADVVSGLGDGSSEAGSQELDGMMDRVRMARGGTTQQAPPTDAGRLLPR
tara:strand:- start:30855 stop:31463 length:609 start_codon:yes stop_codon:yes gene_type:complete